MKNLVPLLFILSLFFTACSIDQVVVNELEGTWSTSSATRNGNGFAVTGDTWVFNSCTDVTQGDCTGTYSTPSFIGPLSSSFEYIIYDAGTKLSIDFNSSSNFPDVTDANIEELTTTTLTVNYTRDGDYYEQTLERQ